MLRLFRSLSVPLLLLPVAAHAQCEKIDLLSVTYAPFTDTALEVTINYDGAFFMSYPCFSLIDAAGDTLAREWGNFFGVSNGQGVHRMDRLPDVPLPATPFTGRLTMSYFTADSMGTCSFVLDQAALCPAGACEPAQVYLYNATGTAVDASFDWWVTDAGNSTVASGIFNIEALDQQQDFGEVCLPAGDYTVHTTQVTTTATAFTVGLTRGMYTTNGPRSTFPGDGTAELPFNFFPVCAAIGNGVEEHSTAPLLVRTDGTQLWVSSGDGSPLGTLEVMDASGRSVARTRATGSTATIGTAGLARGVYLLRGLDGPSARAAQRFILP